MVRSSVHVIPVIVVIFVFCCSASNALRPLRQCPNHGLANGLVIPRAKGRTIRYKCLDGFKILGDKNAVCMRGIWEYQDQKPVCVRTGCLRIPPLLYGQTQQVGGFNGAVLTFTCNPGYELTGSQTIYCNSYRWNATSPKCIAKMADSSTSCDFENSDLCGWSQDPNHHFDWTRYTGPTPSTSVSTGPSWDHTKGKGGNGYYMYIESSSPRLENDTARLVSPVYSSELSSDACFIFYYHMFGQTIGTLNVYVKPEGQPLRPAIFSITGQQGNKWVRAVAKIAPLDENFQIVIEGVRGSAYLSDSAVDDVRLANETDCDLTATTTDFSADTTMPFDADVSQSCRLRCFTPPPSSGDVATVESQVDTNETVTLNYCDCHATCPTTNSCCEDFSDYCIEAKNSPTPASATTSHRTVASFPYSPPTVAVVSPLIPPQSEIPSVSPSSNATALTSPTTPSAPPTSASIPQSTTLVIKPSENPTTFSSTVNKTSPVTLVSEATNTSTQSTVNPPIIKVSPVESATTSKFSTTAILSSMATSLATKELNVLTKSSSPLPTISSTKSTSPPTISTVSSTISTSPTTKSTSPTTKSIFFPTKSTISLTKSTSLPTKSTSFPTKSTISSTKSTSAPTKPTIVTRRTPPPFSWPTRARPTTKAIPSSTPTTSSTSARPPATTSKESVKSKDKQNSVNVKELIAKETSYLENSQLLKEKPAKNKGNTWQMAQRAAPSRGLSSVALYSGLAAGLCVVLAVGAATSVFLVRRRQSKLRRRFDDDSEVRFLTADEILDFTIAQPKDEDL